MKRKCKKRKTLIDHDALREIMGTRNRSEIAREAGISRQFLCDIEAGRYQCSLDVALSLSHALDVPITSFMKKNLPDMKVYLASRYSRREEMVIHAADLRGAGFDVTSRWINGNHQISDEGLSVEAKAEERARFAIEDYDDLAKADIVINFTESPRATNSRGGRHVEFGIAIALGKCVLVVGPRENVFHCLPHIQMCSCWYEALQAVKGIRDRYAVPTF